MCPPMLRKNIFTNPAIDNIDHNPSSTTAEDSFHGTGIFIFQHPRCEASGASGAHHHDSSRRRSQYSTRRFDKLPPFYTDVPSVILCKKDPVHPKAGHVWAQMLIAVPNLPSPSEWGWVQTNKKWTGLPEASKACRELISKKGCRSRCKCVKAALQCTALCQCGGQCDRD